MPTSTTALQIFSTHRSLGRRGDGPENVRVFSGEEFLFASFDHGREQILDVRAHDRLDMIRIYLSWYRSRVRPATPDGRPRRTPPDPARDQGQDHDHDQDRESGRAASAHKARPDLALTSNA